MLRQVSTSSGPGSRAVCERPMTTCACSPLVKITWHGPRRVIRSVTGAPSAFSVQGFSSMSVPVLRPGHVAALALAIAEIAQALRALVIATGLAGVTDRVPVALVGIELGQALQQLHACPDADRADAGSHQRVRGGPVDSARGLVGAAAHLQRAVLIQQGQDPELSRSDQVRAAHQLLAPVAGGVLRRAHGRLSLQPRLAADLLQEREAALRVIRLRAAGLQGHCDLGASLRPAVRHLAEVDLALAVVQAVAPVAGSAVAEAVSQDLALRPLTALRARAALLCLVLGDPAVPHDSSLSMFLVLSIRTRLSAWMMSGQF